MPKRNLSLPKVQVGYPDATPDVKVGYPGLDDGWTGDRKRGVASIELAQSKRKRPAVKVRKTEPVAAKVKRKK